jgi:hypothetical protein
MLPLFIPVVYLLSVLSASPGPPAEPLQFLQAALREHRIVFLGDIHPLAEPKRLVSRLIRQQREDQAIDLLALEVAAEQQEWIDQYLASKPEDTRILLDHPRTLRAHWGISAEYLEIYRAVYRWNTDHDGQSIHILAADQLGSPRVPRTPRELANRDMGMAASFRKTLQQHPTARVLIFMGGYHGLKGIGGEVTIGRASHRFDRWFAGYLADDGADVYTIFTDARQADDHAATRVFDDLAAISEHNFAVALDSTTDHVTEPLHTVEQAGFKLEFRPSGFALRSAVDAMGVLKRTTLLRLIR